MRITSIETAIPAGIMPNLLLVRVHTDAGLIGCGETYYTPHAVAALIWLKAWLVARAFLEAQHCHVFIRRLVFVFIAYAPVLLVLTDRYGGPFAAWVRL